MFNLKLNREKCEVFPREVIYFGYTVKEERISTDKKEIATVQNKPVPPALTVIDLWCCGGHCFYFRKFICRLANAVKPCCTLMKWEIFLVVGRM